MKEKSQVYLCASWGDWSLKSSIERLDKQHRKFATILIITEAKIALFFKCTRSGFVYQKLRDFVKMTLTRVSSHCLWLELSHSVKNVTRLESSNHFSQRDSSRVQVTKNRDLSRVEPSHWLESSYHWFLHFLALLISYYYYKVLHQWFPTGEEFLPREEFMSSGEEFPLYSWVTYSL